MSTLYENISSLCEERGISGYRVCKDVKISPSILTDLKKGRKKTLSADYANRIANYFGVSVDRVLYGKRDEPEKSVEIAGDELGEWLEDLRSRPETKTLLSASRGMTKEQVEKMAIFMIEMKKGWND